MTYLDPASEGVTVEPRRQRVGPGGTGAAMVTLEAPAETGFYRRYVAEHRYLAVLPVGVIDALHRVHPWLPVIAVDAVVGVPFYFLGVRLLGTARVRPRSRESPSRLDRLLARFR